MPSGAWRNISPRHGMQVHGEAWLTEGLQYASKDSCPFCGQQLIGVELIQAYREFFSREYHALRDEVTDLGKQVEGAIGERVTTGIEQALLQNSGGLEFWQQYCTLAAPSLPEAGRVVDAMTALRQAAQSLAPNQERNAARCRGPGRGLYASTRRVRGAARIIGSIQ